MVGIAGHYASPVLSVRTRQLHDLIQSSEPRPQQKPAPVELTPTTRRLSADQVKSLCRKYKSGSSVRALSTEFSIHRTTVMAHLERTGITRRANRRKMTDTKVKKAATQYRSGDSLAKVGRNFGVDPETIRRELKRVGEPIRNRRGR